MFNISDMRYKNLTDYRTFRFGSQTPSSRKSRQGTTYDMVVDTEMRLEGSNHWQEGIDLIVISGEVHTDLKAQRMVLDALARASKDSTVPLELATSFTAAAEKLLNSKGGDDETAVTLADIQSTGDAELWAPHIKK